METVFDDGTVAGACPMWSHEESKQRARDLGYGDDLWRMTVEHEIAHTLTAELRGDPHSIILWNVSHGDGKRWPPGGKDEEARALALMRLNHGDSSDAHFLDGYDLIELMTGFQGLIDIALTADEEAA